MRQGEEAVVVDLSAASPGVHLGVDVDGRSEQVQRLIDQMRAEVEQDPATGTGALPPPRRHLWPEPGEPRLEAVHLTERAVGEQRGSGERVAVPPPVVEHRERHGELGGAADQQRRLGGGPGQWLVDHGRLAELEGGRRESEVAVVRRGHHHRVVLPGAVPQLVGVGDHVDAGDVAPRLLLPARIGSHHVAERQPGHGLQQRPVQDAAGEAVAEQRDPNRRRPAQRAPSTCSTASWSRWPKP